MKEIQLTRGMVTQVDDDMYEYLNQWKWYAYPNHGSWYAVRGVRKKDFYETVRMHRVVLNAPLNMHVDHIDHNTLNNQRGNLRICSRAENAQNRKLNKNNKTGYKGVHYSEWGTIRAAIRVDKKTIYLGVFPTLKDAAIAYDEAAVKYHGEFAYLNFPHGSVCD